MKKDQNSTILKKAKKKHFDLLRKNNAITDAKNGELSLGAMKSLDVILQIYQEQQEPQLHLELAFLRKKLGLEKNNDYVDRIKAYLLELKLPFELRDFADIKTGKKINWALTSFLHDVKTYKDTQHMVEINISENFIDYMIEKAGYTNIDLTLSKRFKTKYGYKIYEMFLRYYSIPNKIDNRMGTIKKDLNDLNEKFGTKHKHPSKMIEGITRGIKEILNLTGEDIYFFYDKLHRQFVFTWMKHTKKVETKCIIPKKRVDELVEWILLHNTGPEIDNLKNYTKKIKLLILENTYDELEAKYRGMLKYKYKLSSIEIDNLKSNNGIYKNFS